MRYIILFILFTNFCFSQNQGSVLIDSEGNSTGLIITKDPSNQTLFSPALLVQDKPNTIYPPIRNDGILFEVRANNSPPVGRPLLQVQGEGAIRMWDYCDILPSLIPASQWFVTPHILGIGSDLAGSPGAVNLVIQNQRDAELNAQGGHPFIKLIDMNTGTQGIVPGENRLFITGGGSLKYGDDNTNSPNLVPYWPGDAYEIDGPKQPNFAVRNAIGQRGTDFGGMYTKFNAVQNDIFYINTEGSLTNFINREPIDGSIIVNNEKKLQIYDGIKIGNKTGLDGTIQSDYGHINFLNTKIGYNINPLYKADINSDDDLPLRIQTPTSLFDFRQNLSFESPGTIHGPNSITNLPSSTLNLWSTSPEADQLGASISFGTKSKLGELTNPYFYGQIHCSKKENTPDYSGSMKLIIVGSDGTSNERLTIEESGIDINGILTITKTHPVNGAGIKNGSLFKGVDGALYYKSDAGNVTLIAPN